MKYQSTDSKTAIKNGIQNVLTHALPADLEATNIHGIRRLDELISLDSMIIIDLMFGLEREFEITFDFDQIDIDLINDVERLVDYIEHSLRAAAGATDCPRLKKSEACDEL